MRHAKTKDVAPSGKDFDRELEEKGWQDAAKMGDYFKHTKNSIDLIVASPSVRTRQTALGMCRKMGYDSTKILYDSTLYRCTYKAMVKTIRELSNQYEKVLIIAHNPAITEVSNLLQVKQYTEVPTGAVVAVQSNSEVWNSFFNKKHLLLFFADPRDLNKNGQPNK